MVLRCLTKLPSQLYCSRYITVQSLGHFKFHDNALSTVSRDPNNFVAHSHFQESATKSKIQHHQLVNCLVSGCMDILESHLFCVRVHSLLGLWGLKWNWFTGTLIQRKQIQLRVIYVTTHFYLQFYLSYLHLSFYFVFNQDAVHIIKAIMHKIPDSMNFNVMVLSRKWK
jgi:hypothetical protein